ncbi:MAG: hypothetical protein AB1652_03955 [Bacillota bacterium]
MFKRNQARSAWLAVAIGTVALTIPFIFIFKSFADSLRVIANKLDLIINPPAHEEPKT